MTATWGWFISGPHWYNPSTGNWISEDPLGLKPNSNPYRFVENQPTDLTDPSGEIATGEIPGPNLPFLHYTWRGLFRVYSYDLNIPKGTLTVTRGGRSTTIKLSPKHLNRILENIKKNPHSAQHWLSGVQAVLHFEIKW